MCYRYEKQHSNFVSCLERSESASKPESQYMSADKAKLRTELQDLQVQYTHTNIVFRKIHLKPSLNPKTICKYRQMVKNKWFLFFLKNCMFPLQALRSEVQSLEPAHAELISLGSSLYPTAPEDRVKQLKDELAALQRRLHVQNEALPQR